MSSLRLDALRIPTELQGNNTNEYYQYIQLSKGIEEGNVEAVTDFLNQRPDAVDTWINLYETPLLKACAFEKTQIVKELLCRMTPEQMFPKMDKSYHTPLTVVAANGNMEIAEVLVAKNPNVLKIPDKNGKIPVVVAVENWEKKMARYLYIRTPVKVLFDENGYHATKLLISAISYSMPDIALDLFGMCRRLAVTKHPRIKLSPIIILASKPEFLKGAYEYLGPLERLLYSCIHVKLPTSIEVDRIPKDDNTLLGRLLDCLSFFTGVEYLYRMKVRHLQIQKLLLGISEETQAMGLRERETVDEALRGAVISGNLQFLKEMVKNNSELLWSTESSCSSELFFLAIVHRQTEVLKFLNGLKQGHLLLDGNLWSGTKVLDLLSFTPADRLVTISGAAAQMQSEFKWFSEIMEIAFKIENDRPSTSKDSPFEYFKREHEPLRKEAEKSTKDMAKSYSLVAALIVTITFAAVFTVPGGTDDNSRGKPFRLDDRRFMIFIVSDMISCLAACASVLIFLGILTSRYYFEDFIYSLPMKMIAGLLFLFVSIAAMLTAFWSALFITTLNKKAWFVVPVVVFACFPAILFLRIQYPLLREMIVSTFVHKRILVSAVPFLIIRIICEVIRVPLVVIYIIWEVLSSRIEIPSF